MCGFHAEVCAAGEGVPRPSPVLQTVGQSECRAVCSRARPHAVTMVCARNSSNRPPSTRAGEPFPRVAASTSTLGAAAYDESPPAMRPRSEAYNKTRQKPRRPAGAAGSGDSGARSLLAHSPLYPSPIAPTRRCGQSLLFECRRRAMCLRARKPSRSPLRRHCWRSFAPSGCSHAPPRSSIASKSPRSGTVWRSRQFHSRGSHMTPKREPQTRTRRILLHALHGIPHRRKLAAEGVFLPYCTVTDNSKILCCGRPGASYHAEHSLLRTPA